MKNRHPYKSSGIRSGNVITIPRKCIESEHPRDEEVDYEVLADQLIERMIKDGIIKPWIFSVK
jgi:hypothetical protein